MAQSRRTLVLELTVSLIAKAIALAAIGALLFAPEQRPDVDFSAVSERLMGEQP